MRFLHTADLHLGAIPDLGMPWSEERAQALWDTFRRIIDTAGKQHVDLMLIAGDFFHRQPTETECKEVNYLFSTISHTRVVIIAGEHDYIRETSPYLNFHWNANVTILSSASMSSVYFEDLNLEVHGLSYTRSEIPETLYDHVSCPDDGRYHVLLAHGGDETHIPIHIRRVADACFDYVALGHLHNPQLSPKAPIAYSGSPEPIGPDDAGAHGYIMGTLDSRGCHYNWYPCSHVQYETLTLTVDRTTTQNQVIDSLRRSIGTDLKNIYRIRLEGIRNPQVSFRLSRIRSAGRILNLIDETVPDLSTEKLARDHEQDLISAYIAQLDNDTDTRSKKALCYGLRALMQKED